MTKMLAAVLAVAVAALAGPALGSAGKSAATAAALSYRLTATMTAKQMTKPHPTGVLAKARGSLVGTMTVAKPSVALWTLTFSGMTGQVKAAEVRYPASGTVSVIRLCAPCVNRSSLRTTFPSKAVAQTFVKQARAGKADVLLKTKRNRGGEVRGVVKVIAA